MGCAPSKTLLTDTIATERSQAIDKQLRDERKQQAHRTISFLLLGAGESGKTSLLRQLKLLYDTPWSDSKREDHSSVIVSNTLSSMCALIEAVQLLDGLGLPDQTAVKYADVVTTTDLYSTALEPDVVEAIEYLWALPNARQAFARRHEYQLSDSAEYFFNNVRRIGSPDWVPTDQDILRSRVKTTGVTEATFTVGKTRWRVTDVGGQRSERRKWLACFDNIDVLIFMVAISEFDQLLYEDETVNRLTESVTLFESVVNSPYFQKSAVTLMLNKTDLFREKLQSQRLADYLRGYNGDNSYESGLAAMRKLFERLRKPATTTQIAGQTLYVHATCAIDTDNIRTILAVTQDQILRSLLADVYAI